MVENDSVGSMPRRENNFKTVGGDPNGIAVFEAVGWREKFGLLDVVLPPGGPGIPCFNEGLANDMEKDIATC